MSLVHESIISSEMKSTSTYRTGWLQRGHWSCGSPAKVRPRRQDPTFPLRQHVPLYGSVASVNRLVLEQSSLHTRQTNVRLVYMGVQCIQPVLRKDMTRPDCHSTHPRLYRHTTRRSESQSPKPLSLPRQEESACMKSTHHPIRQIHQAGAFPSMPSGQPSCSYT